MKREVAMQQKAVEDKIIRIECKKWKEIMETEEKTFIVLANRAVYSVYSAN